MPHRSLIGGGDMSLRHTDVGAVLFVVAVVSALAGCSGSLSSETQAETLVGQATLPPSLGGGPVANAPVELLDFEKGGAVTATTTSDANGNYGLVADVPTSAAIVVAGRAVISGLIAPDTTGSFKNFDGATTIACFAGLSAVLTNRTISAAQLNAVRIRNLELGAQRFVGTVNFLDVAGSVIPAGEQVRILTNDGANPPPPA